MGAVNPPSLTDVVCEAMGLTVCDELNGIDLAGWKALAPAQQSALILGLVRRAHAARIRAVGPILSLRDMGLSRVWTSAAQSGCERI